MWNGCLLMNERQISMEELYQKEMREMQKEINYLRHRVVKLNAEVTQLKEHTNKSVQYLQDTLEEYDGTGHA